MSWSCDNCGKGRSECECKQTDDALAEIPDKLDEIIVLLKKLLKESELK